MYNIGPLDKLNRLFQQLSQEGGYWIYKIRRLIPGQSSSLPDLSKTDTQGTVLLPIVIGGCLLVGCCLCVGGLGAAYYILQNLP